MKQIYIVLTHTGTILSRIIKTYTKDEFSHVSISLDVELKQMYSFGRLNPYNPFMGGFVHEYIDKGTFKRFYKTVTSVRCLTITDEQYNKAEEIIKKFEREKDTYKFNVLGLFAAGFHKKIGKENSFYCAEFVKYVLDNLEINLNLPEVIKPEDFAKSDELTEIYSGLLRKYKCPKSKLTEILKKSLLSFRKKEGII